MVLCFISMDVDIGLLSHAGDFNALIINDLYFVR